MMKRIISIILVLVSICCMICSCSSSNTLPEEEQIKSICELATLECYYNNVAKSKKEAGTGLSHLFEKDREFWIEYEGVAKIGIDMSRVTMKVKEDTIVVTIPDAELLSISIKEGSQRSAVSNDSLLNKNKITADDQQAAIKEAQKEMEKAVMGNKDLFDRAEKRAKTLIENYINELGEVNGKEYTIAWKEVN